jgi:hypothetical protein
LIGNVPTILLELYGTIEENNNNNNSDNNNNNNNNNDDDNDRLFKREMIHALNYCDWLPADARCERCDADDENDDNRNNRNTGSSITLHRKESSIATLPPVLFVLRKVNTESVNDGDDDDNAPAVAQTNAQLALRGAIATDLLLRSSQKVGRRQVVTQQHYRLFGFVVRLSCRVCVSTLYFGWLFRADSTIAFVSYC